MWATMTENSSPRRRLDDLLSQDSQVVSFPFDEFRMNLQTSIQELEQKAHKVRIACYWGLAATIACMLLPLLMSLLLQLIGISWTVPLLNVGIAEVGVLCGTIAFWTTGILTFLYWFNYKPAIERTRSDLLQATILTQLQNQVSELSRKIDTPPKP